MEHDFLSRSRGKISGSNGISEKVVLFFRMEYFKQNSCSFLLQSHLWFVHMENGILERNLPVENFAYHLPKPWSDWFAYVNGKQLSCKGAFHKSELAGRTMPDQSFCKWDRLFPRVFAEKQKPSPNSSSSHKINPILVTLCFIVTSVILFAFVSGPLWRHPIWWPPHQRRWWR